MSQPICIYSFGEVTHRADWNFKVSGSLFWRIYLISEGEAEMNIYGKRHRLSSGHLYLIPAFVPHEDILEGEFRHFYLHFRLDDPYLNRITDKFDLAFEIPSTPLLKDIFGRFAELLPGFELHSSFPQVYEREKSYIAWTTRYENLPTAERMETEGYVRVLLSSFIRQSHRRPAVKNPRVARGRWFIDTNFGNPISIDSVASEVGMRTESFIRAFKQEFHQTPNSYLSEKRINKAKDLLLLTSLTIKEISAACGFRDPSYFCQAFKRNTSASPGEFRRGGVMQ